MSKNIAILFDGTWANTRNRTNVTRLRESIEAGQVILYHPGVGTRWYDRITGGLFGRGLSETIRDGYRQLIETYRDGDQIFVFGFSRGAYSARSLVGLIRKCGLLKSADTGLIGEAYDIYRVRDLSADSPDAVRFRERHSRTIRIRCIGVWDTVGSLGIPISHVPFNSDYYRFHDTELSGIVDYAYHAIAADEARRDFNVTLWTRIKPENLGVEQRWFIGAHGNVGGGLDEPDPLPNLPLRWLQERVEAAGLRLKAKVEPSPSDHLAPITDSYAEFLLGAYRLISPRTPRVFGKTINERIDTSVVARHAAQDYRPVALAGELDPPPTA